MNIFSINTASAKATTMKFVTITNWKDLATQFGTEWAKTISKDLRVAIQAQNTPRVATVPCNPDSDAIALFDLQRVDGNIAYYEYTGTAN